MIYLLADSSGYDICRTYYCEEREQIPLLAIAYCRYLYDTDFKVIEFKDNIITMEYDYIELSFSIIEINNFMEGENHECSQNIDRCIVNKNT